MEPGPKAPSTPRSEHHDHEDDGIEVVELDSPDDTVKHADNNAPLPRLDEFTRFRPRRAPTAAPVPASPSSRASGNPRSNSPPRYRTGPVSIRESKEIPIPLPHHPSTAATPPPPPPNSRGPPKSRPRTPATQRANPQTWQGQLRPPRDGGDGTPSQSPAPVPVGSAGQPSGEGIALPSSSPAENQTRNPKIHIPKIPPLSSSAPGLAPPPDLAQLATGLEGMFVDEFGNVLDWEGRVLGRVEGDLPAMVGRPVSATGEIFTADGTMVGYVVENELIPPPPPEPRPLDSLAGSGLRVDHLGNILDGGGKIVGHFNLAPHGGSQGQQQQQHLGGQHHQAQDQTGAASANRSSAPSPSEIYLDVKSTNDGIQIIMKIPTVFNRGMPNVHIS